MAKRRLTQRQRERIQSIQQKRRDRAEQRASDMPAPPDDSLGAEQPGLIVARYGHHLTVEHGEGQLQRCVARQNLDAIVCGDRVVWQSSGEEDGVITALQPRKNLLARPGPDGRMKAVAANIDQIVVVIAPRPEISENLLDRYLVAAELCGIHPVILINKTDLLNPAELQALRQRLGVYERIGYALLFASTHQEHGLDILNRQLRDRTSILVGQSGVGKSSLVKALLPDIDIRIGAISEDSGLGRHTTSSSMLYHLPLGGELIDSPGVRDFGLWDVEPEAVIEGFPDLRPFIGQCKFSNCSHRVEPGCALQQAVADGTVSARRLNSYFAIHDGLRA